MRRFLAAATLAATVAFGAAVSLPAFADADPTMDQIYTAAAGGHLDQAQQMITQVLADHPTSAKAHYVQAELYAKEGKTALARSELGTAEQLKPGLPFASPRSVQELKAQLGLRVGAISPTVIRSVPAAPRFPWGTVLILAGVVGKAHARQMNEKNRKAWSTELERYRSKTLDAPSWLWSSVVSLIGNHETAYLEHCRRYAMQVSV